MLPGRLDFAGPAGRRLEWCGAASYGRSLALERREGPRFGVAQMAQQRNPAPVEAHQGGAGHIHYAGIFAPDQ